MWQVILHRRFAFKAAMANVTDNPNNFAPDWIALWVTLKAKAFTDGVFISPIFALHRFINNRHGLGGSNIAVIKEAAFNQRYIHGLKVSRSRQPAISPR